MKNITQISQLYLRVAIGVGYIVPSLDRLGVWGPPGGKNISWGNWQSFLKYASETMSFLPTPLITPFAVIATTAELLLGSLLIIGKWTRIAAMGSGLLSLLFALSMTISFGIVSPLSYSVFTLSAGSFLLSSIERYSWSLDQIALNKNI
ncbi:DoxX family membrane protein [Chryseolinea sp. T2]|uniref:DoxX family membrane protein n=1 Tax=Chryseolinea sp. T2 TaxID=3129255 RepID=UPI0030786D9D